MAKKTASKDQKVYKTKDLVDYVAKETGWSTTEARQAVKTTFEGIAKAMKKNDRVTISGMGSFTKTVKPAQKGGKKATNPFTGEEYTTKAKPKQTKVKFRPAKNFKEILGG